MAETNSTGIERQIGDSPARDDLSEKRVTVRPAFLHPVADHG